LDNNSTSTYQPPQKPIRIGFEVMGLNSETSDFLNKCLKNRDNLEFIFLCKVFEKCSQQSILHHDVFGIIQEIDNMIKLKRF
jgi:hypothetical protein